MKDRLLAPRPDNEWMDGQVQSWEDSVDGNRAIYFLIQDPAAFKKVLISTGEEEVIELDYPLPGHKLTISYIDIETGEYDGHQVILDQDNLFTFIPSNTTFEIDTTESSTPLLRYTCVFYGENPLVEF